MIVYIHGAHMTSAAFNYIRAALPEHESYLVEYNAVDNLSENINRIVSEVKNLNKEVAVVGHSLGGVIAMRLLQEDLRISDVITLAAPLGGIDFRKSFISAFSKPLLQNFIPSEMAKFVNFANQLTPLSTEFINLKAKDFNSTRALNVVANYGKVFSGEETDMVVSVKSQKALADKGVELREIKCSHGEILLRPETVSIIKDRLFS